VLPPFDSVGNKLFEFAIDDLGALGGGAIPTTLPIGMYSPRSRTAPDKKYWIAGKFLENFGLAYGAIIMEVIDADFLGAVAFGVAGVTGEEDTFSE